MVLFRKSESIPDIVPDLEFSIKIEKDLKSKQILRCLKSSYVKNFKNNDKVGQY
jgi:hypothetical protein